MAGLILKTPGVADGGAGRKIERAGTDRSQKNNEEESDPVTFSLVHFEAAVNEKVYESSTSDYKSKEKKQLEFFG